MFFGQMRQYDLRERTYTVYNKYTDEVDSTHKSRTQALIAKGKKDAERDFSWRIRTLSED